MKTVENGYRGVDRPELSIILPAFNVSSFIEDTLSRLLPYLEGTGLAYELFVVNDGSTDATSQCLAAIAHDRLRILTLPRNLGKGAAIKHGIRYASGAYIIMTDADLPYGLESLLHCYKLLQDGYHLAIGDRTLPDSRQHVSIQPVRGVLSTVFALLVALLLPNSDVRDTQCGLKGFETRFAKQLLQYSKIDRFAMDLEVIVFALENEMRIVRFPVTLMKNDTSSVRIIRDAPNVIGGFFRIIWNKYRKHYRLNRANA